MDLPTPAEHRRGDREGDRRRQDRLLPQRRHPAAARGAGRRRRRLARPRPTGRRTSPSQPGGKPVIGKFILALMNPGDEVLYPNPGYPIYESQIEFHGGVGPALRLRRGRENFELDFDALEAPGHAAHAAAHLQRPAEPDRRRELARGARARRRVRPAARPRRALRRGLLGHPLLRAQPVARLAAGHGRSAASSSTRSARSSP